MPKLKYIINNILYNNNKNNINIFTTLEELFLYQLDINKLEQNLVADLECRKNIALQILIHGSINL